MEEQFAEEKEATLHLVRRDPRLYDEPRSRWTLAGIRRVCAWLRHLSESGVWRALQRLDIHWRRGRDYIHSPDPQYLEKLARIETIKRLVRADPVQNVLLYLDELTYYRQPTVGYGYELSGWDGPLARRSTRANTPTRIVAVLNWLTAETEYLQGRRIGTRQLVQFYEQVVQHYPHARRLYVVQDNWPVHHHPDILAALEPQETPFGWNRPPRWGEEPSTRARQLNLPIQILQLPTYASWTNPIEKLWRYLKQEVLHLHRWADDLSELRAQVAKWLDQFQNGSTELLKYVGLLVPK